MALPPVALSPNPHWVVIDNFSKLPPGAVIYTYNMLSLKYQPAYVDAAGTIPYPQPIPEWGSGNGTFPPIYWLTESPYYIQVWTGAREANGSVMLWDFSGFLGGGAGGGGGNIVTNNSVENLVINGTFFRPLGVIGNPGTPLTTSTLMILAPSNNAQYVNNALNPNGYTGPDIAFAKSNTSATDSISFNQFIPSGANTLLTDVTPPYYVNYNCTRAGSETYKFFQFPISNGIVNLSNQTVAVRLWANLEGGNPGITLVIRQFYGDGTNSPSPDLTTIISPNFVSGWTLYTFTVDLPNANGTIGNCGNDGTFLQIKMPLSVTTNFSFIKPGVFLSAISGDAENIMVDYHTNDYIDSIVSTPRTGDIRTSINSFYPYGWVLMNDGTIGDASSNATARANIDTFPLFDLIWNAFQANQPLAPMYTSGGAPAAYGASSIADFSANNQLALTRNTGRVMAGSVPIAISQAFTNVGNVLTVASTASFITGSPVLVSGGSLPSPLVANINYYVIILSNTTMSLATSYANALSNTAISLTTNGSGTVTAFPQHILGSFVGEEQHLQLSSEVAQHIHPFTLPFSTQSASRGGGGADTVTNLNPFNSNTAVNSNGGHPFNITQPTVYLNIFVKL